MDQEQANEEIHGHAGWVDQKGTQSHFLQEAGLSPGNKKPFQASVSRVGLINQVTGHWIEFHMYPHIPCPEPGQLKVPTF